MWRQLMIRLEIKKKVQYDINRETANTPAWSPGKIDKYDYVTGDEILPSNQSRFTDEDVAEKKAIKDADEKQTKALQTLSAGQLVVNFQEIF